MRKIIIALIAITSMSALADQGRIICSNDTITKDAAIEHLRIVLATDVVSEFTSISRVKVYKAGIGFKACVAVTQKGT